MTNNTTALFLAAGYGSRIADVTNQPKCLLEINGKALIDHHLEKIETCGIKSIHIVTGYEKEKIINHLEGKYPNLTITFSVNEEFRRLGNTYSMMIGLKNISSDVMIFDADLMYDTMILKNFVDSKNSNAFLVGPAEITDIECAKTMVDTKNFVRLLVDKRAVSAEEQQKYKFIGEAIGIMKFSHESRLEIIKACEEFFNKEENLIKNWEHLFSLYLLNHDVAVHFEHSDKWIEIDNREDYNRALEIFRQN